MTFRPKKPMKGEKIDEKDFGLLKFPLLASPKLDGFRCLKLDGKALSSTFKPIRNKFVREYIEKYFPDNLDGELLLDNPNATFVEISSAFSSFEGHPAFQFWAFDYVSDKPYQERYIKLTQVVGDHNSNWLKLVHQTQINSVEELLEFEAEALKNGFEGVMIRSLDGPYKSGKASVKQGWLLKIKRFEDSDAEILGYIEAMENQNEATKDELGRTKRSSKKENKVPKGTLGAFIVRDVHTGVEFEIGTGQGLTDQVRQDVWDNQEKYKDLYIKYQYQKIGTDVKPRLPSWLGFRPKEDVTIETK